MQRDIQYLRIRRIIAAVKNMNRYPIERKCSQDYFLYWC